MNQIRTLDKWVKKEVERMFIVDNVSVATIVPKWMPEKNVEICNKSFWDSNQKFRRW